MDGTIDRLSTDRLTGERLRAEDWHDLRRLHRDPRVMATLSAEGVPLSKAETRERLRWGLDHWERYGYGIWLFREKGTGRFVGYCGLHNVTVEGSDAVELLYAVMPAFWGRGLATEMAGAVLTLGRERFGLTEVVSYTLPANRASRRVMEKNGFTFERDTVHAGLPHVLYRRTSPAAASGRSHQR